MAPRTDERLPGGADEKTLREWVEWNRASHERRGTLHTEEGRLLRALQGLAARQEDVDAREADAKERFDAAIEDNDAQEEEVSRAADQHTALLELSADLAVIESRLVERLGANQDEQQRLLEDLVEELSENDVNERDRILDERSAEEEDLPRRGRLRLAYSRDQAERDGASDAYADAIVDRIISNDPQAWAEVERGDFIKKLVSPPRAPAARGEA